MDVNAIIYTDAGVSRDVQHKAADNIKRVVGRAGRNWADDTGQDPYLIADTQEIKTTWHPIGS
jgi:hypothetical protein